uniref:Uncharacterized protein n=1 Tax=Podarcis muralis TaxID=64176 RepID=A0A670K4E0_PODMU
MSPSPFSVATALVFTTLPLLTTFVLSFTVASEGIPGTEPCRLVTVCSPKFRTTINT